MNPCHLLVLTWRAPGREGRQTSFLLDTKQVMKVNEELLNLPETDKHWAPLPLTILIRLNAAMFKDVRW